MKTLRLVILGLAVPVGLAAQAGGPPANPVTTVFKGRITALERNIAQAFDSIPEAKFGYKPTPAQLTIGYIAQHLASDNYFFCNNFGDQKATVAAKDTETADSVKAKWPRDTLVAKLKASFAFCQTALNQVDDTKLADQVTVPGPNGTTRQLTRAAALLGHALDLADHYSQLANYMRLNNIIPPTALPRPPRPAGN
jgi:uncharacterized damage-inducible protein DinB